MASVLSLEYAVGWNASYMSSLRGIIEWLRSSLFGEKASLRILPLTPTPDDLTL